MNKDDIIEKIPEYLNGNLSDNDIRAIESAAERDESIRMEIEFMKSIQQQILSEKIESPTEWGWARLKQTIERQNIEEDETDTNIHSGTKTVSTIKPIWKKLAIAASFAFVIQSGYLVQQNVFNSTDYQLLSTKNLENSIQIQFKTDTSEQAIRQLLINTEGNIINGPSALGIYTIEFKDRETALTRLNESEIVEYAELSE
ncbi:MAG: S8 family serine peptidase [Cellvibrionaceae bacterium]